jgi:hypothetical protein
MTLRTCAPSSCLKMETLTPAAKNFSVIASKVLSSVPRSQDAQGKCCVQWSNILKRINFFPQTDIWPLDTRMTFSGARTWLSHLRQARISEWVSQGLSRLLARFPYCFHLPTQFEGQKSKLSLLVSQFPESRIILLEPRNRLAFVTLSPHNNVPMLCSEDTDTVPQPVQLPGTRSEALCHLAWLEIELVTDGLLLFSVGILHWTLTMC